MAPPDPWLSARMRNRAAIAAGETELYPAIREAIRLYLAAVRQGLGLQTPDVLTATGSESPTEPDWHGYPDDSAWTRLVQQVIAPVWRRLWHTAYYRTVSHAGDNPEQGRAGDASGDLAARLRTFPRRVWDRLRQAARNVCPRESSQRLRTRLAELASPDIWLPAALTMTRTEVHTALNAGALAAALDEQARTRTTWAKTWVATADERTRPAHRAADGQQRRLNEPFDLGGDRLQFPGDPRGTPSNTINCRCSVHLRPV